MLTAELTLWFLPLLYLAHRLGLEPRALTTVPPLDLLVALGAAGAAAAEFLVYVMLFAAYQLALLAGLRAVAFLRGDPDPDRLRESLSRGRDPRGLGPLLWLALLGAPAVVAWAILAGEARELPRLVFVALLIALAAAQTLRWFTLGDAWRGTAGVDADLREVTRPGQTALAAEPAPAGPPAPEPSRTATARRDDGRPWLDATPRRRGGGTDGAL